MSSSNGQGLIKKADGRNVGMGGPFGMGVIIYFQNTRPIIERRISVGPGTLYGTLVNNRDLALKVNMRTIVTGAQIRKAKDEWDELRYEIRSGSERR